VEAAVVGCAGVVACVDVAGVDVGGVAAPVAAVCEPEGSVNVAPVSVDGDAVPGAAGTEGEPEAVTRTLR